MQRAEEIIREEEIFMVDRGCVVLEGFGMDLFCIKPYYVSQEIVWKFLASVLKGLFSDAITS